MTATLLSRPRAFTVVPALRNSRGRIARGPFVTYNRRKAWIFARKAAECNRHDDIKAIRWPPHKEAFPDRWDDPPQSVVTIPAAAIRDMVYLLNEAQRQIAADHPQEPPPIARLLQRGSQLLGDCLLC